MNERIRAGIIGCGMISGVYLKRIGDFKILEISACSDIDESAAAAVAEEFGIPAVMDAESLIADKDIDMVLNLTPPAEHGAVAIKALEGGKSVYNEKPLALTREEGVRILRLAEEKSLFAGCAPDTFMGGGGQTCRKIIDEGLIGAPVAAAAFMMSRGPERWHPNPSFYYKPGGGPLFDMGPYYLTALINLVGPVGRVAGLARTNFPLRVAGCAERLGEEINVETPTHISALLDFESGVSAAMTMTFDVWRSEVPRIEIYGEEATLSVPDPNTFRGPVRICRAGTRVWEEVPLTHGRTEQFRSIGAADMAYAMVGKRPHRANAGMAFHVLDIMHAILESSDSGRFLDVSSSCPRPAPLPEGLDEFILALRPG